MALKTQKFQKKSNIFCRKNFGNIFWLILQEFGRKKSAKMESLGRSCLLNVFFVVCFVLFFVLFLLLFVCLFFFLWPQHRTNNFWLPLHFTCGWNILCWCISSPTSPPSLMMATLYAQRYGSIHIGDECHNVDSAWEFHRLGPEYQYALMRQKYSI